MKINALIFSLMCLISHFVSYAQTNDTIKLQKANELKNSNPPLSREILNQINNKNLSPEEEHLFSYLTAFSLTKIGQLDESIRQLTEIRGKKIIPQLRSSVDSTLVIVYAATQQWEQGLDIINSLLSEYDKNPKNLPLIYSTFAIFYNFLGEHQLAQDYAVQVINSNPNNRWLCAAESQRLFASIKIAPTSLTKQDFINAIKHCELTKQTIYIQGIYVYFAEFLLKTNSSLEATKLLQFQLADIEKSGNTTMAASYYELFSEIYYANGQFTEAEQYAHQIIDTEHEHQNVSTLTTAYKILAKIYELRGDDKNAYKYYKNFIEFQNINLDQEKSKLLAVQKAKLNNFAKMNKIILLDKENALLKAQTKVIEKQSQNERLMLTLVTLLLVMLIVWVYRSRRFHKQFRKMAQTDELTGISNRHHLREQAENNLNFCRKANHPLSFIIFDLDHFKKINDSFGHQIGDWAIKAAVKAAYLQCRKNDIIGRIGGEEFAILLPSCDVDKALKLAESCRAAIAAINTQETGKKFQITASFGVTDTHHFGYNFDTLFAAADDALYTSKDLGRNTVNSKTNEASKTK